MSNNRIIVQLDPEGDGCTTTEPKYRHDYGQCLEILGDLPQDCVADISNDGSKVAESAALQDGIVEIPDRYFETGKDILVYLISKDQSSRTTFYEIRIPVLNRAGMPNN